MREKSDSPVWNCLIRETSLYLKVKSFILFFYLICENCDFAGEGEQGQI